MNVDQTSISDLIPETIKTLIRDRYIAGVATAESMYSFSEGDEDALSGALGQAISMPTALGHSTQEFDYMWQIFYKKLRGRGPGAPEKRLGADGIFQIEIKDASGKQTRCKGLPFQAKKGWNKSDRKLIEQSRDILNAAGDGILVDYTKDGYTACSVSAVVESDGSKKALADKGKLNPLGQILGNEFLNCQIGVDGLHYDSETEEFITEFYKSGGDLHVIDTTIVRSVRS